MSPCKCLYESLTILAASRDVAPTIPTLNVFWYNLATAPHFLKLPIPCVASPIVENARPSPRLKPIKPCSLNSSIPTFIPNAFILSKAFLDFFIVDNIRAAPVKLNTPPVAALNIDSCTAIGINPPIVSPILSFQDISKAFS